VVDTGVARVVGKLQAVLDVPFPPRTTTVEPVDTTEYEVYPAVVVKDCVALVPVAISVRVRDADVPVDELGSFTVQRYVPSDATAPTT
jgi:hypothetical protein